jgi:hypothetical protein
MNIKFTSLFLLLISVVLIFLLNGCSSDSSSTSSDDKELPEVTTGSAIVLTSDSVNCSGTVTDVGSSSVTVRGISYGTSSNPSSTGISLNAGSGKGDFSVGISGLQASTLYYYQAFATNEAGTSYGSERTFTTLTSPTMPKIILTIANVQFNFDTISGLVTGSVYEAGFIERVDILALTAENDTLRISLVDNVDNEDTLAIQPGKSLNIDVSESSQIYSTLVVIMSDGTIYEATSGVISISKYELPDFNSSNVILSGSVDVNASGTGISGTLTDILLDCTECGG